MLPSTSDLDVRVTAFPKFGQGNESGSSGMRRTTSSLGPPLTETTLSRCTK